MTDQAKPRPRPTHYLYQDGRRVGAKARPPVVRLLRLAVLLGCIIGVAGGVAVGGFLWSAGRAPREWAPYLQRRADGHRPAIAVPVGLLAGWLIEADRMNPTQPMELPEVVGALPARSGALPASTHLVASLPALAEAAAGAQPGDTIVLAPGHYRFGGYPIKFARAGTAIAPVTVRAARLGDTVIETDAVETFKVSAPFLRFENLVMRGVCGNHSDCEHAIHVVGAATDIVIRNNRFEDFNAHIKINGENGRFPDHGLIEGNTFTESAPRATTNPITPIDLVAASDWRISGNIIADFVRADPAGATYGAFVKGAGENNVMERNLVICEWHLRGLAGQRIGLSLGGGGTDPGVRREQGRTGFEQVGSVIRDNLIVGCSDAAIYLNRSARSLVERNTLLDTAGIDARFIESSATVVANIVDGPIYARDGATITARDNKSAWMLGLFVGIHPQRGYFREPAKLDLRWRTEPVSVANGVPRIDLCGHLRTAESPPGAFEDYARCLVTQ